ncbi:MAG TPA: S1C family serine protease [Candidatus Deferrimicrobium sp.]|nr:S1C family serine protease [Candidatus Deferrimicrobium sp.]
MLTTCLKAASRITLVFFAAAIFSRHTQGADTPLSHLEQELSNLIYTLTQSVVTVESSAPVSIGAPSDWGEDAVQNLVSSGVIYDLDGHILVAAPAVVGREMVMVRIGEQVLPAQVLGVDYQSGLAVIRVSQQIGRPAVLDERVTCAGEMVIVMGNAYGMQACPSLGFCAGMRPDGTVQVSAPISSGSIGGGVFDLSGHLLGLITGGIGIESRPEAGFAVPAREIPLIVEHLVREGDRPVGYIGLSSADIEISPGIRMAAPATLASSDSETPQVITRGIMVTDVVPASPAARAGLRMGDVLLSIDGAPLQSVIDLRNRVRQTNPGTVIEVSFLRDNARYRLPVTVGQLQPNQTAESAAHLNEFGMRAPADRRDDSLRGEIASLKKLLFQLERQLQSPR